MPPIALTPNETWEYQLQDDYLEKPELAPDGTVVRKGKTDPNGTWWTLGAIPAHIQQQIQDAIVWEGESLIHANRGTVMRLLLEHGVRGVRNWRDADGRDVVIHRRTVNGREVADLTFLDRISVAHRTELANATDRGRRPTAEEKD